MLLRQAEGKLLKANPFGRPTGEGSHGVTPRPLCPFQLRGQLSLVSPQGDKPPSNHSLVGCSMTWVRYGNGKRL